MVYHFCFEVTQRLMLTLLVSIGLPLASGLAVAQTGAGNDNAQDIKFWEELAFWDTIKDSTDPAEYEAYLKIFPKGRFAPLAKVRIQALRKQQTKEPGEKTPQPDAATTETATTDSKVFRDCPGCPLMVVIPAGRFVMGSDRHRRDEQPPHEVTISQPFALGRYPVTVAEWQACVEEQGCRYRPDAASPPKLPVGGVSWDDTQDYIRWLSKKTGIQYRLPSEAEWEYAARAGTTTDYWWGDDVGVNQANCKGCGSRWDDREPAPVDAFAPNPFGLYQVHGNLWEWVEDCWRDNYRAAPTDGSAVTIPYCIKKVMRGGNYKLEPEYMRVSRRFKYDRDVRYYLNGFRVARSLP